MPAGVPAPAHPEAPGRVCRRCTTACPAHPTAPEPAQVTPEGQIGLPRPALEDVEIGGVPVRRGEAVISPHLATTDPAHVCNPDHFDIARRDRSTTTFGGGPHYCLGSSPARAHLHEALQALVERLPDLTLAVNAADVPWMPPETLFTRPRRLPVTW